MKINKATAGRPDEDRVIDAPYIMTDLSERIGQLKSEAAWSHNDRNGITVFKSGPFTVVLSCFHKDAVLRHQGIDGFTTIQVVEGKIKLVTGLETAELPVQKMITLYPDFKHEITMLEDSALLIITSGQ